MFSVNGPTSIRFKGIVEVDALTLEFISEITAELISERYVFVQVANDPY